MPWQELSVMRQREEFVRLAMAAGANVSELCRRFGISRAKGYKWLERYRVEGRAGLADRSRRPARSPSRTPAVVEAEVLRIRAASNNVWAGRKIARVMRRNGAVEVPAPSTITAILRRHGKLDERQHEHPGPYRRFEWAAPNELWQMDFKGHFGTAQGRCHPLTVLDDHSRYSLMIAACGNEQDTTVRAQLLPVFRRYGLPLAMLMDNGSPWGDAGDQPHTIFTAWLLRLGVRVIHIRPLHPQTQGKDERFHRTLKAEVLSGRSFRDLPACQTAFDRWRHVYNHERPHEALALATPAERYHASARSFPEVLPTIEYGPGDIVRKVDQDGFISFRRRSIRVGKAFRGHPVAFRQTDEDGVLSIHFCAHRIGTLDLRDTPSPACGRVDNARALPTSPTGPATTSKRKIRLKEHFKSVTHVSEQLSPISPVPRPCGRGWLG
jgi:transposase InsO family protein